MKCMAWSRNLEWNTDLIETAEFADLIGQTSQCLHSGEEHHESQRDHAYELPEVRRCTEDEHTISRLDAKHVEDANVVLEYREARLQSESQTDNQIVQSW